MLKFIQTSFRDLEKINSNGARKIPIGIKTYKIALERQKHMGA